MKKQSRSDVFKQILESRSGGNVVPFGESPDIGEYVATGMQQGNISGEKGWDKYVGYVVQIRKKAGCFGSDIVFLRDPSGILSTNENQFYYRLEGKSLALLKSLYPDGITPDLYEDYSRPYTIGNHFPETGRIIEANDRGPCPDNSPLVQITTCRPDGTKTIEVV